jgi:glyoxylase-like metal-dependent hydrolase (beta-lactamase superfamily II)
MKRKTFLQNLGVYSGLLIGAPGALAKKNDPNGLKLAERNGFTLSHRIWDGFEPDVLKAPWGQSVIYDRYSYIDLHNYKWRIEGIEWKRIREKAKELDKRIDDGEIPLRNGPLMIVDGIWLLDVDGQQNIYVIESNDGLILVDPGMETFSGKIIEQLKMLGYQKNDVRRVLLTHCHVDHAQSASFWSDNGAKILIHKDDLNAVATGNEITAWWTVHDEKNRFFPPVKEGLTSFEDGDIIEFGDQRIYICHTPGHTPGSSCFYLWKDEKNILISGDTIFHNGKHGWMGHPYVDYEAYINSLWKLKNFAVEGIVHNEEGRLMVRDPIMYDILLPGHTAISLDMVDRDIDKGIEIMSYTIQERRNGNDYQWTEPYSFFAERIYTKADPIRIEYR